MYESPMRPILYLFTVIICLVMMPIMVFGLIDVFEGDSPSGKAVEAKPEPAEPAQPIDWNPLIIVASVVLALVVLAVLIYVGVRIVRKKKADDQARKAIVEANTQAWKYLFNRHDAVKDNYYRYAVDDLDLILRFPALQDTSEEFVKDFLQAFYAANDQRPSAINSKKDPAGTDYLRAVGKLERTWEKALSEAARIASSRLTTEDRKRLKRARKLWAVVSDDSATVAERSLHARQLQKCLDGLIRLDDKPQTRTTIESAVRAALPSGQR